MVNGELHAEGLSDEVVKIPSVEITLKNGATGEKSEYVVGGLRGFMHAAEIWFHDHNSGADKFNEFHARFVYENEEKR